MNAIVERLDDWGRPGWFAATALGFVLFFPLGLAMLAYMIWSGRMGCASYGRSGSSESQTRWERKMARMQERVARWGGPGPGRSRFAPTGNRAFDEYREETLRRLEDEAQDFQEFLARLRMARDKAEFDQYMADRRSRGQAGETPPESGPAS